MNNDANLLYNILPLLQVNGKQGKDVRINSKMPRTMSFHAFDAGESDMFYFFLPTGGSLADGSR